MWLGNPGGLRRLCRRGGAWRGDRPRHDRYLLHERFHRHDHDTECGRRRRPARPRIGTGLGRRTLRALRRLGVWPGLRRYGLRPPVLGRRSRGSPLRRSMRRVRPLARLPRGASAARHARTLAAAAWSWLPERRAGGLGAGPVHDVRPGFVVGAVRLVRTVRQQRAREETLAAVSLDHRGRATERRRVGLLVRLGLALVTLRRQ